MVTRHILHECPILRATTDRTNGMLSVLCDRRYKAIERFVSELTTRVRSAQRAVENGEDSWIIRQTVAFCISGVTEGSVDEEQGVHRGVRCDPKVLRIVAGVLYRLRVDGEWAVRVACLDICGRIIGLKEGNIDVDKGWLLPVFHTL